MPMTDDEKFRFKQQMAEAKARKRAKRAKRAERSAGVSTEAPEKIITVPSSSPKPAPKKPKPAPEKPKPAPAAPTPESDDGDGWLL